jgi:5'-nucleotidase/UDP-sugar diphosphatase
MIIGGHSHTMLDKPACENNILIAQAGVGSNYVGRFDITVDDDTNCITDYRWHLVAISDKIAAPDLKLMEYIDSFKQVVDRKYNTLICRFATRLTHPVREEETTLGNLVADIFRECAECDVMFMGAGAIRSKELGPAVTLGDLKACFPFDDSLKRYTITGSQLIRIFTHIMRPENRDGEGECYEVNAAVRAVYNDRTKTLESLTLSGEPIDGARNYTIGLIGYHADNATKNLNITPKELMLISGTKVIATSTTGVIEEYLRNHQNLNRHIEGRLVYTVRIIFLSVFPVSCRFFMFR